MRRRLVRLTGMRHTRPLYFRNTLYCDDTDDGSRSLYTLTDKVTGESQTVVVCQRHGELMPAVDDDLVRAEPAEAGLTCDFHPHKR